MNDQPINIKYSAAKLTAFRVIVIRYLLLNCYNLVNIISNMKDITGLFVPESQICCLKKLMIIRVY
jgi:hypothetical protein